MPPLADYIWMNGEMTPWAEAKVHVMSHALHYGTSVFEGVRVYDTPDGPRGLAGVTPMPHSPRKAMGRR